MSPEQLTNELRKEIGINDRLKQLLLAVGKSFADETLRKGYSTNDAGSLIRLTGEANGVERFLTTITADPKHTRKD